MPCWFQNSSSCGWYTRWQKSECVSICDVTWSWWEDLFWWEYMCTCTCVFAGGWWRTVLLAYWTAWTTFKMKTLIARTLEPTCCLQLLVARTSVFFLNKNKKKQLILTSHACLHRCVGGCPFTIIILACPPPPINQNTSVHDAKSCSFQAISSKRAP